MSKNLYHVLGVTKDSSESEIKSAYRKLARKYMPELRCGNPFALSIAKELGDDVDIYIPIFDILGIKQIGFD